MNVVAVVGLGYACPPLAVAFGEIVPTIGHDLSGATFTSHRRHLDPSGTVSARDTRAAPQFGFALGANASAQAGYIIVAVPTPSHASLPNVPLNDYLGKIEPYGCIVDMKSRFGAHALQASGLRVWRL